MWARHSCCVFLIIRDRVHDVTARDAEGGRERKTRDGEAIGDALARLRAVAPTLSDNLAATEGGLCEREPRFESGRGAKQLD